MARFEVTDPEGNRYEVSAPEGAAEAQVLEYARSQGIRPQEQISGQVEQVNTLRQVMRSLKPDEREVVTRAVVGRLGRATPAPGARAQLFPDSTMRSHLEMVANASARNKESARVGQNYSNTAGNIIQAALYGTGIAGTLTGNASWAPPTVGGAIGTINMSSRLLTNGPSVRLSLSHIMPGTPLEGLQRGYACLEWHSTRQGAK